MKIFARSAGIAAASVFLAIAGVGQAQADSRHAYCDDYASQVAEDEAGGAAVGGAVGGAATGAIIGGILDGGGGAGRGALIGGGAGLLFGAIGEQQRRERVYAYAYEECMDEYDARARQPDEDYTRATVRTEPEVRPEPWTDEWYAYCSAKYRSFDRDTGYYLAYSGKYRFCQ